MIRRDLAKAALALTSTAILASDALPALARESGIIRTRSGYPMQETVDRITRDIADKKIMHKNAASRNKSRLAQAVKAMA